MLQRLVFLPQAITLSAFFPEYTPSAEKDYKSANTIIFDAIEQGTALFGKATFAMDRGYDDNKMFLKLDELGQEYVIRLTAKENFFITTSGLLPLNFATAEKAKSKPAYSTKEKTMKLIFPT